MTNPTDAGGPGREVDWRSRARHLQSLRTQLREMRREPADRRYLAALALATAAWIAVVIWMAVDLPDRVPQHWSWGPVPDRWSGRTEAVATSLLLPLVVCFPPIRLSRLVIVWPDDIDVAHKDWWLANATRLNRFERLLREDLILFATVLLSFMTCEDVATVRAAHRAGGVRDPAEFWGGGVLFLAVVVVWVLGRIRSGRYDPRDDVDGPSQATAAP